MARLESSQSLGEIDAKILDLEKRIRTQESYIAASEKINKATSNAEVLRANEKQIRESQRTLSYFKTAMRDLQDRRAQLLSSRPPQPQPGDHPHGPALPPPPPTSADDYSGGYASPSDGPRPKQYSNLDLIKAETPYTTAKISRMLEQLEFKLQVENQYKKAIQQMTKLYQADGDKKSRADADVKRIESDKKIQLLQVALKRYRNLHILDEPQADDDRQPGEGDRKDNLRKPLSGKLHITIREARDLDHAPLLKRSSKVYLETTVVIKVEGTARASTLSSRTDRWNQDFEIAVDKANEVEITLYDRQAGSSGDGSATPIGLLWIRLNDVAEALRRQRVGTEGQGVWVTADSAMQTPGAGGAGMSPPGDGIYGAGGDPRYGGGRASADAAPNQMQAEGITAWFAVEPAGALALDVNFVKENVRRRPVDAGKLGRQGAVRMRPREVHEMNGHKFVARQFYQIMMCAYCSDFLLKASGYQCEDCRYTCHRECYPKVVTKCISKSNAETEADEDKINHRIPHRFETMTNMRANWCCHCGYMLPLGRKNAKKCSECDITCHASCAHLVPDFCGMTMEKANILLHQIQEIKSHQKQLAPKPKKQQSSATSAYAQQPQPQNWAPPPPPPPLPGAGAGAGGPGQQDLYQDFNNMQINPAKNGHGRTDSGSSAGYPPGAAPPMAPGYSQQQQQPPPPPKASYDAGPYPYEGAPAKPSPPRLDPYGRPYPDQQLGYADQRPGSVHSGLPPQPAPPSHEPQVAQQPQKPNRQSTQPVRQHRKVGLDDFNFLAVLGKGNFGKVMLAEEKRTNGLYAIKVLKKEFIIENDEVESTQSEKRVFLTAARERHPFLLGLHSCFQTETRVYFVMEYVSGGDLMLHIQRKQFSLRQAKFYAAEVLLALEYFHANGIIYRDLKLDNILLTLDGHVKVADYGLCKEEMYYGQTTGTFCGTPEFMAPEILLEQRYGRAVDWWAFGVLMYEMLLGQSPFRGDDEDEIFDAILEDDPLYPVTMPRDAVSILQKLLTRDPNRRLGSGQNDAEDIKAHPFFKDTNFDDVFHKRIPPPYYPQISNSTDVSNFDSEFTREQPTLTPVHGQLSLADQNQFVGFSWVRPYFILVSFPLPWYGPADQRWLIQVANWADDL
ncbi:kinase-like protein [Clavulina sp. PMI_390]|nr:kinase-like protein [Clavulina sp. PMI_390]